ncbi:vesicle-associated protein 1-4-like isoform X2 [Triticum dicoccoides]|uniref:vesicle-associated protein 1-4-like isoform X2 n=1 Tax=Triticum dicoccoides TaxID=85692 RepID=UPI00189012FD|nr:vesicle-associated protein 1-4-like isoform X2 [Triticum dicoccoides]
MVTRQQLYHCAKAPLHVIDSMSEIKITELPIVLTETSSPASYELIHFDPPELFFPILPNKKVLSSIKIVNITDYNVGFNTYSRPTNAAWCHTEPARGILPPQSTQKLMVTRERKEEASEHMQVNDKYFVWNSIVTEGVKDSDLGDYMVEKESKELPIVLSKISSLTSNELIQFDPAELHFPFSPQEIFPFTFDIINITDFNVAFNVYSVVKNAARRKESFMEGILPPRSTRESTMVWQLKEMGPGGKEYELEDKIFFWSRLVTEGVEARDIIGYMSEEESKELPIFFHKESSPCASNELIQFDPPELNFHVLPNKVCVFSVNVVNSTDYYVAFSTGLPNSKVAWYVKPSERIMPPKTTQRLVLKRTAKEKELGDMQCQDKLFLCNRIVSEDAEPSDIIGDMDGDLTTFSKELRIVLHMIIVWVSIYWPTMAIRRATLQIHRK